MGFEWLEMVRFNSGTLLPEFHRSHFSCSWRFRYAQESLQRLQQWFSAKKRSSQRPWTKMAQWTVRRWSLASPKIGRDCSSRWSHVSGSLLEIESEEESMSGQNLVRRLDEGRSRGCVLERRRPGDMALTWMTFASQLTSRLKMTKTTILGLRTM